MDPKEHRTQDVQSITNLQSVTMMQTVRQLQEYHLTHACILIIFLFFSCVEAEEWGYTILTRVTKVFAPT